MEVHAFLLIDLSPFCVCCRYGECHPVFFIGTLEAASQEAFYGKARDVSNNTGACLGSMIYRFTGHDTIRPLSMFIYFLKYLDGF